MRAVHDSQTNAGKNWTFQDGRNVNRKRWSRSCIFSTLFSAHHNSINKKNLVKNQELQSVVGDHFFFVHYLVEIL